MLEGEKMKQAWKKDAKDESNEKEGPLYQFFTENLSWILLLSVNLVQCSGWHHQVSNLVSKKSPSLALSIYLFPPSFLFTSSHLSLRNVYTIDRPASDSSSGMKNSDNWFISLCRKTPFQSTTTGSMRLELKGCGNT